jgi:hypothetical protein
MGSESGMQQELSLNLKPEKGWQIEKNIITTSSIP